MISQPSEVLAREIRRWRTERKLSAQDLANRLAELGSDLNRRVLSKIENGERGVSLDEWLQIAHALAVPPPLLLLDLTGGQDVALAPDVALHPFALWEWVTGEQPPSLPRPDGGIQPVRVEEFNRSKMAIALYRVERRDSHAVRLAQADVRKAEYAGDSRALSEAKAAEAAALQELAICLDHMVESGMVLPGEPAEWVEKIRSLGLSQYPDRLVTVEGRGGASADGGSDQAG